MRPTKACPVVLRADAVASVLVFEHPLAGTQLVKGTIEPGETAAEAALRELHEESGIVGHVLADLGTWEAVELGQVWALQHCASDTVLPEAWTHEVADDGGRRFRFRWHPLGDDLPAGTHDVYRSALAHLRTLFAARAAG